MLEVSDEQFQELIDEALASLPGEHAAGIQNVAILFEDEPTPEQRQKLQLRADQSLFGLYEGIPLSRRQGNTSLLPDRITLFKLPMLWSVSNVDELKEQIRHTLWHEIAHYYGLDHEQIHGLE